MKTLKEYMIFEMAYFSKEDMKVMFGKATVQTAKFCQQFERFLSKLRKEYSINNKQDRGYLWNIFKQTIDAFVNKETLKEFHCDTPDNLARILGDNIEMINKVIGKNYIKDNLAKKKKEFTEWQESDKYMALQDYDKDDPYEEDEELGRAFVIYYAYDPADTDLVKVYRVKGKVTNPNTKHDMNLHRMDWNWEFKLGYYHANTCTVEHYRNSGKEELMREFNDLDEE